MGLSVKLKTKGSWKGRKNGTEKGGGEREKTGKGKTRKTTKAHLFWFDAFLSSWIVFFFLRLLLALALPPQLESHGKGTGCGQRDNRYCELCMPKPSAQVLSPHRWLCLISLFAVFLSPGQVRKDGETVAMPSSKSLSLTRLENLNLWQVTSAYEICVFVIFKSHSSRNILASQDIESKVHLIHLK